MSTNEPKEIEKCAKDQDDTFDADEIAGCLESSNEDVDNVEAVVQTNEIENNENENVEEVKEEVIEANEEKSQEKSEEKEDEEDEDNFEMLDMLCDAVEVQGEYQVSKERELK